MARIKKYAETLTQHLTDFQTYITDTNPNSDYFRISEFNETLTGGKNGFQIEGSEHLLESVEIKIEITDVEGNSIYYEPGDGLPEYYEGISKIVSIHIYEDTPIGEAKITILGELKTYVDGGGVVRRVPPEWQGIYNLKWEKTFKVNRLLPNTDKVRLYKRPKVSISEIVKPLFSNVVTAITKNGNVQGIPLAPGENAKLSEFSLPSTYLLRIKDNSAWTGSIVGSPLTIGELGYSTIVDEVLNKTDIIVTTPYTEGGLVKSFDTGVYTSSFDYLEGLDNLKTALTGSFAKITLTDLTSFVGDVARVKVFRKSQSDVSDYQFVQELQLESNELLIDLEAYTKNQENYGLFTTDIIKNYWVTSSNNLTATFNQSYLFESVKLDSATGVNSFFTTKSINITKDVEYTLDFNVRLDSAQIANKGYIRAYVSGSRTSVVNGVPTTIQVEQTILTLEAQNAILQKKNIVQNIQAEEISNARLYFDVKGSGWYMNSVSFKASQETAFSPDEITFIQPVPRSLPVETFMYRFEFYDLNNNYIPILVEKSKTFNGGNLQTIRKQLRLVPSSLYFQFDSGSQPVPPTVINIDVQKTLLTGSVNYTSQSIDFFGNILSSSDYPLGGYPGLLININTDSPFLTVASFTGSRSDVITQYLEITGEVEGFTDTIVISRVLDGFGGVNHIIRPFRGTTIRNSSTQSLEIQAIRIDGINEISLSSTSQPAKGWNNIQLHVLSGSKFVNLSYASSSGFIKGLSTGSLGTGQINYNATFNRDSIDSRVTVYLMPSGSNPSSASVLTSIVLEDLQDGLDSGFIKYSNDTFTINPRLDTAFTPVSSSVTASFYKRGTTDNATSASLTIYPSMSINVDYIPQYWMYYVTHSFDPTITILATDDNKKVIPSTLYNTFVGAPASQSKTLTLTFTYTEPYTSASINIDKTFTIVPEGKPGDESIIFEVTPAAVALNSNAKGIVLDYAPSKTELKLKQGSKYLIFTGSRAAGTFHLATSSIIATNITGGLVEFGQTSSMFISASSGLVQLSGSIEYPLVIHPYYTSSIYTQSYVQQYTKVVDGPPAIDIQIEPLAVNFITDENGTITDYTPAKTTVRVKEGTDILTYSTLALPGTFQVALSPLNITPVAIGGLNTPSASVTYTNFNFPNVSASVDYSVLVYPYSLGAGHRFTSSLFRKTQNLYKNVTPSGARTVKLTATSQTLTYDTDGVLVSPLDPIILTANALGTTGSVYFQFFRDNDDYSGIIPEDSPNSKQAQVELGAGDVPASGQTSTFKVAIRDGSSSPATPIKAEDSLTISGVKDGSNAYNVYLTNESANAIYTIQGTLDTGNTATRIVATKGGVPLNHTASFSPVTTDQLGNPIGSLGEYRVKLFSSSSNIVPGDNKKKTNVLNSTLVDGKYQASIGNLAEWYNPSGSLTANIVFEIDIENGRQVLYKTQSLGMTLEGRTGPGIVFRGVWDAGIDYKYDPTVARRDAVLYPDTNGAYYAASSGSGPNTYLNYATHAYYSGSYPPPTGYSLTPIGAKTPGVDTNYWQYLGAEEFFVAAKIAIFEESFIKNTLNIGLNAIGDEANIILTGKTNRPYMAMGQNSGLIGYNNQGIWMGVYTTGPGTFQSRLSLVGSGGNYLRWTGTNLELSGALNASSGNFEGYMTVAAGSMKFGADVSGTNDGLYINADNYWYSGGNFKVGDATSYVEWTGSTMNVKGSITVTGGDAATQTYASQSASTALTSANGYTSLVDGRVFTDSTGKIVKAPSTGIAGLYLGSSYMGYHDGVSTWKTYMADNGNFYLIGTNGSLAWNAGLDTLQIKGEITATSGTIGGWSIDSNRIYKSTSPPYGGTGTIELNATNSRLAIWGNYEYSGVQNQLVIGGGATPLGQSYNTISIAPGRLSITNDQNGSTGNPYSTLDIYSFGSVMALNIAGGGVYVSYTTGASGQQAMSANGGLYAYGYSTQNYGYCIYGQGRDAGFVYDVVANLSDARLKENVREIDNALDKVDKIRGVYFNWTDQAIELEAAQDKDEKVGVIAQEIQAVLPHIIKPAPFDSDGYDKDGNAKSKTGEYYITVQYEKLVPLLIQAIKELKAEVDELKNNK